MVASKQISTAWSMAVVKPVRTWLLIGVCMVFVQIVVGGITRLTDSGLSITEWALIQGSVPPLNETEWVEAFEKYQVAAKKQFESLHANMTLPEFKIIFFWEYIHRLWARLMGFVFLFPFIFFLAKGWMPKWLLYRLGVVILLAMSAATFGWIMVKSGLNDDTRTWVSAYKLITHLGIATTLFGYLFWTYLKTTPSFPKNNYPAFLRRLGIATMVMLFVQILFGGLMAGMRAGLVHPYFPAQNSQLFAALNSASSTQLADFVNYEPSNFVKTIVQILHRSSAYLLTALVLLFVVNLWKSTTVKSLRIGAVAVTVILATQITLGILTVVNSIGRIPLVFGVLHQGVALLLLITMLYLLYQLTPSKVK